MSPMLVEVCYCGCRGDTAQMIVHWAWRTELPGTHNARYQKSDPNIQRGFP